MVNIRVSAYNPDGKQCFKSINGNHHTQEEVQMIELAYKKHIHNGLDPNKFFIKDVIKMPSSGAPEIVKQEANVQNPVKQPSLDVDIFPRKALTSIKTPENNNMSWACIGSTRSGKTYAMKHLYDTYFKKHITILMTHSGHAEIYKDFKKNTIVSDGFHKELIDEPMKINKMTKDEYQFCLIFDDLGLDGKICDSMTNLLTRGRNCGMSCIYAGQKLTMLSSTGRSNINYVLCFYQNTDTEIENTVKCFLRSYFPKGMRMPDCIALYRKITQDHNFICIDTLNNDVFISKI
jgi:hypothetical protein